MAANDNAAMQAGLFERRHGTMEKVISEFKIIETEDGFRIEIKGDKKAIRRMLSGFDFCDSFTGRTPFGRSFHFGPGFWSGFGSWCGPWERTEAKERSV
jgi:hypothetical protein